MTVEKAVEIVQNKNPLLIVRSCLDFGSFYVFALAPIYISKSDEYVTGTVFPAVDKKSGKIFEYDITSNLDAYERSKVILLE